MKYNVIRAAILAALSIFLSSASCRQDPDPTPKPTPPPSDPDLAAKMSLRDDYMSIYYYWVDEASPSWSSVPILNTDIYDYFDALLYKKDRWSWMTDKEYYLSSETGVQSGTYGGSLSQPLEYYDDYDIHVRYVYLGSPFANAGVTRGWTLTHLGGVPVMDLIIEGTFSAEYAKSPQTFTFKDIKGESHTFNLSAATSLQTSPSLLVKTFDGDDFPGLNAKIGYFHYLSFKANFLNSITSAMQKLKNENVSALILDLRYNGGGDARASQLLVDCLAPDKAAGSVYVTRTHNKYLTKYDYSEVVGESDPSMVCRLGIERLYVITGEGSASASEMIINGLRPFMDVKMVGDTTYGKPNGMYVLMYPGSDADYEAYEKDDYSKLEWIFLPICFYNMNGRGEQIPDSGFVPDNYRPDDLYHDFDASEDLIRACLSHYVTGTYPALPQKSKAEVKSGPALRRIPLAEEQTDPHYGTYTVKNPEITKKLR